MNERQVVDNLSKLERAGINEIDKLPLAAVRVLAEMSDDELNTAIAPRWVIWHD